MSDVTGADGGGLLDSFIHSTFINMVMRAYNILIGHKAFVPDPERQCKSPQRCRGLLPRVWADALRLGLRAEGWCPSMDNGDADDSGEQPAQPSPRFSLTLSLL